KVVHSVCLPTRKPAAESPARYIPDGQRRFISGAFILPTALPRSSTLDSRIRRIGVSAHRLRSAEQQTSAGGDSLTRLAKWPTLGSVYEPSGVASEAIDCVPESPTMSPSDPTASHQVFT